MVTKKIVANESVTIELTHEELATICSAMYQYCTRNAGVVKPREDYLYSELSLVQALEVHGTVDNVRLTSLILSRGRDKILGMLPNDPVDRRTNVRIDG